MMSIDSMQHSVEASLDRMQTYQKHVDSYYVPPADKSANYEQETQGANYGQMNLGANFAPSNQRENVVPATNISANYPSSNQSENYTPANLVRNFPPPGEITNFKLPSDQTKKMFLPKEGADTAMELPTAQPPVSVAVTPIVKTENNMESNSLDDMHEDTVSEGKLEIDMPMENGNDAMEKPAGYDDMLPSPELSESVNSESAMSPSSTSINSPAVGEMSHSSTPDHMKIEDSSMNDWNEDASTTVDADGRETYFCHLCSYSGNSKFHFNSHMNSHFEHHCQHCDYTSRTEGRLKRHIKDFHSQVPPPNYSGQARIIRNGNVSRPKIYRCKQCEFISQTKEEFWDHARSHIKEDKILQCPKCPFVTEYKHHLEYHLRNHFGSKPFKCTKCNYSCVNKSMLNSHMKSHTNIYQFRCADCTYATKYCHSLKLHLRKYNHKPASVLNLDGTVDETYDCSSLLSPKRGPPRGPRGPRKDKMDMSPPQPPNGMMGLAPPLNMIRHPGMLPSPYWPVQNGVHIPPPPLIPALRAQMFHGGNPANQPSIFRCTVCGFKSEFKDELSRHMLTVHARENQDLFSMFGINSDALMEDHLKKMQPPPEQLHHLQQQMMERQNALQVRTEHDDQMRSGPMSWPNANSEDGKPQRPHPSQSLPDLFAEKKRRLEKGDGKPTKESPLDLTKPREEYAAMYLNHQPQEQQEEGPGTGDEDSQNPWGSDQTRRNRRKGRAFKLDALCLKLQEKCDNSGELIEDEGNADGGRAEKPIMTMPTPIMTKSDSRESQKDENHNGTHSIDYSAIHESLSRLNNEAEQFPHKKYRYSGSGISEAEERQRMAQAFSMQQKMMFMQQGGHGFPFIPVSSNNVRVYPQRQQPINGIAVANKTSEVSQVGKQRESYECHHCDIAFRDCIMYTMHMGYHGYQSPFKCNMCGHEAKDKVDFFLHIARVAHN